jgi:hypothetical protein
MQALKIMEALLTAAAPVTALVVARIYPLELPPATPIVLPAIVTRLISDAGLPTIDAANSYQMRVAEVQVHLIARTITELDQLATAVEAACDYQRGSFAGLVVSSVAAGRIGATETDSSLGVWYQPIAYSITYRR